MELNLHRALKQAIYTNILMWAPNASMEYRLSNNKIADIHFGYAGEEFIIEVKTVYRYSLMELVLQKYYGQCDYLMVAFPRGSVPQNALQQTIGWDRTGVSKLGVIEADEAGVELVRLPSRLERRTAR